MQTYNSAPKYSILKHPTLNLNFPVVQVFPSQQDLLNSAIKFQAQPDDIFVCTYSKCGTTWMQNIVWLITRYGNPIPDGEKMEDLIPFLLFDSHKLSPTTNNGDCQRIIKTHLRYPIVPQNKKAKYIYLTRNPKDAFVSYYFHVKGYSGYKCPDLAVQTLLELYLKGKVDFGGYFDHVEEWYQKRNKPNVLFLLYEDLKKDPETNILKIARFLGRDYEKMALAENKKILKRIVELSSFAEMQKRLDVWTKYKRSEDFPFIRKGEIGDWKNHLTEEQSKIMDEWIKEKGGPSGVHKLWKDHPEV